MDHKNLDESDRTSDYPKDGRDTPFVLALQPKTKFLKPNTAISSSPKVVVNKRATHGGAKVTFRPPKPPAGLSHMSKDRPTAKESGLSKRVASEDPEDDRVSAPAAKNPYVMNEVRLI